MFNSNNKQMNDLGSEDRSYTFTDYCIGSLPEALFNMRIKNYLLGIVMFVFGIGLTIVYKKTNILLLVLFSIFFLYQGFSIGYDFCNNNITEKYVICTNTQMLKFRDYATVSFESLDDRTDESGDGPEHFQFKLSGKQRADDFITSGCYLIYFRNDTPSVLLTYIPSV